MRTPINYTDLHEPVYDYDMSRELAYRHALLAGPYSDTLCHHIRRSDTLVLINFEIDYCTPGLTAEFAYQTRQALAFFQKNKDLKVGIDKEAVALEKFLSAEAQCKETNHLLREEFEGNFCFLPSVNAIILTAQRKIARILGEIPDSSDIGFRFGPGATRGTRKVNASIRHKLSEHLQCSLDLVPYICVMLQELPHLHDLHSVETDYSVEAYEWGHHEMSAATLDIEIISSKVTFQEKNAKTLRAACTEPGLNVMFQLGIGDVIAKRLLAWGISTKDQTINQDRARFASINGTEATVDLRSASDTISSELVALLLPNEWFNFLSMGRTEVCELPDGREIHQEKFSSMGNGFTFPLETLIFWALADSCDACEGNTTCYGDDIIIPTQGYKSLLSVFAALGFSVNTDKSFASGPFRESCGKDYFLGHDVRPFFQRGRWTPASLFILHNYYVRRGDSSHADFVKSLVHPALHIFGPDNYGDGHLLGVHPRTVLPRHRRSGYSGYVFDTFALCPKAHALPLKGDSVVPLYAIYRRGSTPLIDADKILPLTPLQVAIISSLALEWLCEPSIAIPVKEGVKSLTVPGSIGFKLKRVYTLG